MTAQTGRLAADVSNPLGDGVSFAARLEQDVSELIARGLLTGVPNLAHQRDWTAPEFPAAGDVQLDFQAVERLAEGAALVKVRYGYFGEYETAMSSQGDVPMHDKAAATTFRALVLLPQGGTASRLVVEVHDRKCPVTALVSWLARVEFERDQDHWARLRVEQMGDPARLRELIRNAESITATLKQSRPGAPGVADGESVQLIHQTKSHLKRRSLITNLLSVMDHGPDEGFVQRVEEIAGYDPDELDRIGLRFNQASIEVEDAEGHTKTLNPEAIRAKFTYEVSHELQPSDEVWLDRVKTELSGPLSEGTDIQW
ncbi:MAG: hypothetical protein L6367_17810 [Cellulomonas sp.]|nr:hypothetical protein [Cellulomonas sp.]